MRWNIFHTAGHGSSSPPLDSTTEPFWQKIHCGGERKKKRNQHANSPCPLLKENKGMMISIRLWLPETILIFQYFWPLLCKLALWQIEPLRRMGLCIRVSGVHGIPLGFDSSESGSLNKSVWRQAEMSKGNWRDKKKVQCLNWTP